MVLLLVCLGGGELRAAPLRFTSTVAGGDVFRDADGNRQLAAGEQVATTGPDGRFTLPKGKGRIFIRGGTEIPGGGPNNSLLTTPPSARGINTLTSLWQALLHRKQGNAKIKKMLNVPASVTLVNYVARSIEATRPKSKPEKLVKRNAQHRTLIGFLKSLAARGRKGVRANPVRIQPLAGEEAPLQDEEIRALAEALIARLEGVKKKQWTATDLTDPTTLLDSLTKALVELQAAPPADADFAAVVDAAATLIGQLEQTDASQPERFVALTKRAELEAKLVEEGRYADLTKVAHTFTTAILVIDPGRIDPVTGALTNNAAPAISGIAETSAVKVRVRIDTEPTGEEVELDSLGQWVFTPAANLAEGPHTLTVDGVDAAGSVLPNSATLTVTVDLTPPQTPTANALQTADTTPTLTGAWDAATGNSLSVAVGGASYSVGTDLVTNGANWTLTIPTALVDGSYPVVVTVTDAADNVATATATLTVDTAAPAAPTVNPQTANTHNPTLSGTWDSSVAGNTLAVSVGGQNYALGGGALSASGNAWFLAIPVALADGSYTVTATGSDGAGNVGPSASATLTIDTQAPGGPTVTSQLTADSTPTVTGTWDAAAGNTLTVAIAGQTYSLGGGITTVGSSWSLTVSPALADGSYSATATGTDLAGNTTAPASGTITVDTTPPAAPTVDTLAFSTTTPTLSGTCSVADTASLTVRLNGKTYTPACVDDIELGQSWLLAIPAADALQDGTFPLQVTATDAAGNVNGPANYDLVISGTAVQAAIITTAAGGGVGDGGPATATALYNPQAVVADGQGNLYVADAVIRRVRRIAADGTITTVAGNGDFQYNGDGGSAVAAALWQPWALAVDGAGNLYIADSGQSRIRKVDSAGTITTVAGNGNFAYSGDGGLATDASLGGPSGVALDGAGNLYIADSSFNVVRKVDAATGNISTVAGGGTAGTLDGIAATLATLSSPSGLSVDGGGNLYLSDTGHHLVRRVDAASGLITSVAGTGIAGYNGDSIAANTAQVNAPRGLSIDGSGGLLIADHDNNRIRRIDGNGIISTVAGLGTPTFGGDGADATLAGITLPSDVAALGSAFYIADTVNNRIRRVDSAGVISTVGGNGEAGFGGDGRLATMAMISSVGGLAVDPTNGDLYLSDSGNERIRKVDASGVITTVAGNGLPDYSGDGAQATAAALSFPRGLAFDTAGNLFIADGSNHRIRKVDRGTGNISTVAGNGTGGFGGDGLAAIDANLNFPQAVAVDGAGNLYIADDNNQRVRQVDTAGIITTVAGGGVPTAGIGDGGAATAASLSFPNGVAVDGAGNLYIADSGNARVRKVDLASGIITTVVGGGQNFPGDGGLGTDAALSQLSGVAVDSSGNVYLSEGYSEGGGNRVRKFDSATGIVNTVAGNGDLGFNGDGGLAIDAVLHDVTGVAVGAGGTFYIGDSGNGRVRKVVSGTVAFADSFTLDTAARIVGADLNTLAVESSSVGFVAWSSVGYKGATNVLGGDTANGFAVPNTNASQPYSLATLPFALGVRGYSISANVYPEVIVGAGATGSLGVGFFMANAEANLPVTTTGTTSLALLVDGSGTWRLLTSGAGSTVLLRGSASINGWSATAPPLLTLSWDAARKTASASLGGVSLFENFDVSAIDPALVRYAGFGCDGPVGAGAVVDNFRLVELP